VKRSSLFDQNKEKKGLNIRQQSVGAAVGIATFGLLDGNFEIGQFFGAIFFFSAAGILFVGERCRHHRRYRKCPLHDVIKTNDVKNPDASVEKDVAAKRENGNDEVARKSSEEFYRTFYGNLTFEKLAFYRSAFSLFCVSNVKTCKVGLVLV